MTKARLSNSDTWRWLKKHPSLDELSEAFPQQWREAQQEVGEVLAGDDGTKLAAYSAALAKPNRPGHQHQSDHDALMHEVQRQICVHLVRQVLLSAATGVVEGRIRFNLLNGYVAQKLLFVRKLERKPVSMAWFRVVWPLLWQRRLLMPLVQRKGIYCFYSKRLVSELASIIGEQKCLEIAAGDGTLSRFLRDEGVEVTATDDYSWDQVTLSDRVERRDAVTALRVYQPRVVICSWPPAGNSFEREVFKTNSVKEYIVIGSRHEASAGNWNDYRNQKDFSFSEEPRLSRMVLPPELDSAVYLFRRNENP